MRQVVMRIAERQELPCTCRRRRRVIRVCPVTGRDLLWQCYRCGAVWEEDDKGKLVFAGYDEVVLIRGTLGLKEEKLR